MWLRFGSINVYERKTGSSVFTIKSREDSLISVSDIYTLINTSYINIYIYRTTTQKVQLLVSLNDFA